MMTSDMLVQQDDWTFVLVRCLLLVEVSLQTASSVSHINIYLFIPWMVTCGGRRVTITVAAGNIVFVICPQ